MLMPGKNKPQRIPMYRYPFTLVQVIRYDDKGNLVCKQPLWLLAIGEDRYELNAREIYGAYGQRYDLCSFHHSQGCIPGLFQSNLLWPSKT